MPLRVDQREYRNLSLLIPTEKSKKLILSFMLKVMRLRLILMFCGNLTESNTCGDRRPRI
jgi:hypothetical protein